MKKLVVVLLGAGLLSLNAAACPCVKMPAMPAAGMPALVKVCF